MQRGTEGCEGGAEEMEGAWRGAEWVQKGTWRGRGGFVVGA